MSLVEIQNEQSRSSDDALNEDEHKQLRTVIGKLNWVAIKQDPMWHTKHAKLVYPLRMQE